MSQCSYPYYSPTAVLSLPGKYSAFTIPIFPIATRPHVEHLIHSLELYQHCGASATRLYSTCSTALGNMAEFMFVNLNNPTQNKRREVRKLVRSHVSYIQHSQKRTELGQVQKPSKSRYTDRSVNGWAVLDDSRAAHPSQINVNAASGLVSSLLPQHQSTVPDSAQTRSPRQLYSNDLTVVGKSRRRPKQSQCQSKAPPTPPTPILGDEVNTKKESPHAVSTLPTVKSETTATSPEGVFIKQELDHETDHKLDIVSEHSSRSQSLSSSSTFQLGWESLEPASNSLPPLYFSLRDPTDELREGIELSELSMSSVMVSPPRSHLLEIQQHRLS